MQIAECLVIIPAYNEAHNIGRVIAELRQLQLPLDLVVIDDGSQDRTEAVVQAVGERVIRLPYNLGYGGAMQTGFKYAAAQGYKYVIQFDADGQHDPLDIQPLLLQLKSCNCDIVVGSRFLGEGSEQLGVLKRLAISTFRLMIKAATGVAITDPTSGLQGLTSRAFSFYAGMGNYPEDFPDADTLINMILGGFRVKEVPARIRSRYSGKSMHSGVKSGLYMLKMLISIQVVLLRHKTSQRRVGL